MDIYLFEYRFASLFDVVIQTVVNGLISSLNDDICDVTWCIKWIYVYIRIWFISFIWSLRQQLVLYHYCPGPHVVVAITTIVDGYFRDTLSATAAVIMIISIRVGFDNGFLFNDATRTTTTTRIEFGLAS